MAVFLERFNQVVEKWMPCIAPSCLIVGILSAGVLSALAPAVPFIFAFMTFAGSLNTSFSDLRQVLRHPGPILLCVAVLHICMPLLAFCLARLVFAAQPDLVAGVVLEFTVPTGIVSLMWVGIHKGNQPLTLSIILLDTLIAPFAVPLVVSVLTGAQTHVDVVPMMRDLVLMIALPAAAAMLLNQCSKGRITAKLTPSFKPLSKVGMMMVITINSTRVAPFFHPVTPLLFAVAGVILLLAICGYVMGGLFARLTHQDRASSLSMVFNSGLRNISSGAVLAAQFFPPEAMLPVMAGTMFQQILAAAAGAAVNRIFGRKRRG